MTNSLSVFDESEYRVMQNMAKAMVDSGFFSDVKQVAQAMVKIQAGREMGLPPFASMSGIHLVQSKPVLGANLIATLVKNDPRYDYRIKQADGQACILTWYESGKPVGESAFTIAEAQAAGLAGKDNWKKYPSDMLFARAISRGARRYAPGLFGGAPVYTPDEFNLDTDEDGRIVAGEIINVTPAPTGNDPNRVYADGSPVALAAVETYDAYLEAHGGKAPDNVHNLRNWFKAQRNGNGNAVTMTSMEEAEERAAQDDLFEVASEGAYSE